MLVIQALCSLLRIGELARLTHLSPDTLRHYERLGLIGASRTPGRFREYTRETIDRVRVIQASLAIGFTLAELSQIFAERRVGRAPCQRVRKLAGGKLVALSENIDELSRLRDQLARTIEAWDARFAKTPSGTPARLLDSLIANEAPVRRSARGWRS